MSGISVVIPVYNEASNIPNLVQRLVQTLVPLQKAYELIFVDDHSTDTTITLLTELAKDLPIRILSKQGPRGKAFSLLEGFSEARYPVIAMIDGDLQYPPEAIPTMVDSLSETEQIIVANRRFTDLSVSRKIISQTFHHIFAKGMHGLDVDVQSGLKVFQREVIQHLDLQPTAWTFDLPFLIYAREAGYGIGSVDIDFGARKEGGSKINVIQASAEIGREAIRLKMRKRPAQLHKKRP